MKANRFVVGLAVAGTVGSSLLMNVGRASAGVPQTPAPPSSLTAYAAANATATSLTGAVADSPGFGSVALTPTHDGVVLYWKGAVPPAVSQAVASMKASAPITVVSAAYTQAELYAERDRLSARSAAGIGPLIYAVGPMPDDSGLSVVVARGSEVAAAALGQTIVSQLGSTIHTTVTEGDRPIPANRQNDTSPFYGGASIRDAAVGSCSTGFRVHSGSTQYMITAWHCSYGNHDDIEIWPANTKSMGIVGNSNHTYDVELIGSPPLGYQLRGEHLRRSI